MRLSIRTTTALLAVIAAVILLTCVASADGTDADRNISYSGVYNGTGAHHGPGEDGFCIDIYEDKRDCAPGEEIKLSLRVSNRGAGVLDDVSVNFALPDGLSFKKDSDASLGFGSLSAGDERTHEVTLTVDDGAGGIPWYIIAPIAGVSGAAAIGAAVALIIKKKKGKGAGAALLLVLCLTPMLFGVAVTAAEKKEDAGGPHLELKVNINGKEKTIKAFFSYDVSGAELTIPDGFSLTHFGNDEVTMEDDYCENAFGLEVDYLLSLDTDRLLAGFRETAGLDTKGKRRYDGWENSLIGGHTMGHYLSACAHAFSNAGISEADKAAILEKINAIVDGLRECQENSRGKPGFIFGATLTDKNNVEAQFDNVEHGRTNITSQAWVPWYTMHKIIAGLLDVYKFTGIETALDIASGLGDWTYERVSGWSESTHNTVLSIEYGGMNDCLYELYRMTGYERCAVAAHAFDEDALFRRVASGGKNVLDNLHANTTIPKFLGALNRYITTDGKTIEGQVVDASGYLKYAENFWDMVVERHTYVTGGNSEWEHFGQDNILDTERTNCNCETCNVYNMLKLSRALFEITGDKKYADYYENAFYNAILSSQNPKTGMTMYFQPMATGYFKVYGEPFTKFWCCTGSGMENFAKLNDSIYFHDEDTVFVNMYFTSTLRTRNGALTLEQRSGIPEGNTSVFTLTTAPGRATALAFRIPDWASGALTINVNGAEQEYIESKNGYAVIGALSGPDIEISVTIPMNVTVHTLPDSDTALAFKYGPIVLSAGLGKQNMNQTTTGVDVTIPAAKVVADEDIVLPDGVSREIFIKNVNDYVKRDGDSLSFRVEGSELSFTPHYEKYDERYGIYWHFLTSEEKNIKDNGPIRTEEETVDTVQPGYGQYENDVLHAMRENNTVGVTNDGTYRYAKADGSFTYRMAVSKDEGIENYLVMRLRREDNGKTLAVKVGDTTVFSDTLDYIGDDDIYEVRVLIPSELIVTSESVAANGESYDVLNVTFSGIDGAESARVCEFIYTKAVKRLYDMDKNVAYFVDCGDHNTYTLSDGDLFGVYNSVTEQLYGYDPVTGRKWGLIDNPTDRYNGSAISGAIYTANTWAYETDPRDGKPKTSTNRYTKNQYENGMERALDYAFELPNGKYEVEIGFSNPWNCSNLHRVYANLGLDGEVTLAEAYNVSSGALRAAVEVKDGILTLNFRNNTQSGLAINVTYIKILFTK